MRRKGRARTSVTGAALAVVLAGGVTACSGSDQDGGSGDGDNSGQAASTAQVAPPGRYHTLPEPCGAVDQDTLAKLFPGVDADTANGDGSDDDASATPPGAYGGEPDLTYDTDRRVGCSWQHNTTLGSRRLSVDFERVVSYDTTVSDDEEATRLFAERADTVGLTTGDDAADDSADEDPADEGAKAQGTEGSQGEAAEDSPAADDDSPGPDPSGSPGAEPTPRLLDGIGDSAYLDDDLSGDDGSARRTVTLVFRTANVLVTVEYTEAMTDGHRVPAAAELEDKAQDLARKLVGRFDDI